MAKQKDYSEFHYFAYIANNKATDFTTLNNTLYPTTQAVENEIYVNMYFSQTPTF